MGLIQREVESRGIRTAAMIHLPEVSEHSRPPRHLVTPYDLGHTFSLKAHDKKTQTEFTHELLDLAMNGNLEEERYIKNKHRKWYEIWR